MSDPAVLITGAGSGIGLATTIDLSLRGFHTIAAVHTADDVDPVRNAATAAGADVEVVTFDVTDQNRTEGVLADHELYALVNNAGYLNMGTIEDIDPALGLDQVAAMAVAPMRLARLALPGMRRKGHGRIVNISSGLMPFDVPLFGWYRASKAALEAASEALRLEVAASGIDVVLVRPGATDTAIWDKAAADLRRRRYGSSTPDAYERALALLPRLRAHGHSPDDVAKVVAKALTDARPCPLYRVGIAGPVLRSVRTLLPAPLRQRAVRRAAAVGSRS